MGKITKVLSLVGALAFAGKGIHAEGLQEYSDGPIINPTAYSAPRGMTEGFYDNPDKAILEFGYSDKTIEVRRNGRVFKKGTDDEYLMRPDGTWVYDRNKNREPDEGDNDKMNPEFGYTITTSLKNAFIKVKENLARDGLKNANLLEKLASAESRLAKYEDTPQYASEFIKVMQETYPDIQEEPDEPSIGLRTPEYPLAQNSQLLTGITYPEPNLPKVMDAVLATSNESRIMPPKPDYQEEAKTAPTTIKIDDGIRMDETTVQESDTKLYEPPIDEKILRRILLRERSRVAFNIGGSGGKEFGYGELGFSWEPAIKENNFGITLSVLGAIYANRILEEITTEPSPRGINGHRITEELEKRMVGGALDFTFGAEQLKILFGGAIHYTNWIKSRLEELMKSDGTIIKSNQNSIPESEWSKSIRMGLEGVLKSGVGSRTTMDVNVDKNQLTIVQGFSYRSPRIE